MSWETKTLGDVATLMSGGTPRKSVESYWDGDIPWFSAKDLTKNHLSDSQLHVTEEGVSNGTRLVPKNTVFFVVRGMSLANEFRVSLSSVPATFNQDLKALKCNDGVDSKFVFYSLYAQRDRIKQMAGEASHGTKKLPTEVVVEIPIKVPDSTTQSRVIEVAEKYDLLIENNRRRIALLEESARLLYKEWFVHLRFPGHEQVKVGDGVPKGWERKSFSKLADFINGYAFKPADLGEVGLPVVKIPELRGGILAKTPRNSGDMIKKKYHLNTGDLLFSWSGTLLVNLWASGDALLNQHLFKVDATNPEEASKAFLHYGLKQMLEHFMNQTTGATMKHIRKSALDAVEALVPTKSLMAEYTETVSTSDRQIITLRNHNEKLAEARDLLLPRLMNGEIKV